MTADAPAPGPAPDPGSLDRLHDVVGGGPLPWWPPTVGWWLLLALVALGIALTIVAVVRRHRRNAYRREALALLAPLEARARAPETRAEALAEIAAVVRRTALSAYPRTVVADLGGSAWLAFLDRTLGGDAFRAGAGRPLAEVAYRSDLARGLDGAALDGLLAAARRWIAGHRREAAC